MNKSLRHLWSLVPLQLTLANRSTTAPLLGPRKRPGGNSGNQVGTALASAASAALFLYVLQRSGPGVTFSKVRLLGWGFASLILLSGARHVLRAVAWSYCVQIQGRRPGALELFGPRLVGEALDDLTPAGPLLGETAKVVVVSRLIPAHSGGSSVVIENLIYALAALLFMLSGVALALLKLVTPRAFGWIAGGLVLCVLASTLVACRMIGRRISLVGRTLKYMKRVGLRWGLLERHQHYLRAVEQDIHDFFLAQQGLFLFVFAIEFATSFTGIGETYLILKATTAHASLFAAYLAESANRAVQLVFSFIPLGLGVQEGVAATTLQAIGYTASDGVSLAILRKMRTVIWTALGLLLAAKYSIARSARQEHSV